MVLQKIATLTDVQCQRLYGIFLLVAILVTVAVCVKSGVGFSFVDEADYYQHAVRLKDGLGYVLPDLRPTAFRPPGYPYLMSAVLLIWQSPLAAKLINVIFLIAAVLVMRQLVSRDSPHTAWLPPLMVCAYPVIIYACSTLYPQIVCMSLLLFIVWGVSRQGAALGDMVLCGLTYGALMLIAPSFQLVAPFFVIYLWLYGGRTRGQNVRALLVFYACASIAITPWMIRNYQTFHAVVPLATNGGFNLLLGNSDKTRPNSGVNVDLSLYLEGAKNLNEIEKNQYFARAATDWIVTHPAKAGVLYFQKVINYFNFKADLATKEYNSIFKDLLMAITYLPLLAIALWRLIKVRTLPLSNTEKIILMLYLGNAFVSAIFFTRIRFRIPFDGLLLVFVAIALGRMIQLKYPKLADTD